MTAPLPSSFPRRQLPSRRPNATLRLEHSGQTFFVTFGYDIEAERITEVFGSTAKATSDFAMMLADACVVLSIALQRGATPKELSRSLNRVPAFTGEKGTEGPASVIGVIIDALLEEQAS